MNFYYCPICGNLMIKLEDSGVTPVCCGKSMKVLEACSVDGASEKHVPVFDISSMCNDGIKRIDVRIGEAPHPMDEDHLIRFIVLESTCGITVKYLKAGDPPMATFYISYGEHFEKAYAYCNVHGLWEK